MSTLPPFPPAWWSQLAGQHQRTHAHLTLPKPASRGRKYQHVVLSPSISQNRKNSWHLQRTAVILWISQRCHQLSPGNHMTRWPAVSSCVKRKGLVCQTLYWSVRGKEKQGIEEKKRKEKDERRERREIQRLGTESWLVRGASMSALHGKLNWETELSKSKSKAMIAFPDYSFGCFFN